MGRLCECGYGVLRVGCGVLWPFEVVLVVVLGGEGRKEKTRGAAGSLGRREAVGLRSQCWPKIMVGWASGSSLSESLSEEEDGAGFRGVEC